MSTRKLPWIGSSFYFIHSYHAIPEDASVSAATADYGVTYTCACERGRLAAVQFHPEKSGPKGLALLAKISSLLQHGLLSESAALPSRMRRGTSRLRMFHT